MKKKIIISLMLMIILIATISSIVFASFSPGSTQDVDVDDLRTNSKLFCVQLNAIITHNGATYDVSKKYTTENTILAYILCQSNSKNLDPENSTEVTGTQVALWYYLSNSIVEDINKTKQKAPEQFKFTNEPKIRELEINALNNMLKGKGEELGWKLYEQAKEFYNSVLNGTNDKNYTANYYILTPRKNVEQKLIYVIDTSTTDAPKGDVSLQKYIASVNGEEILNTNRTGYENKTVYDREDRFAGYTDQTSKNKNKQQISSNNSVKTDAENQKTKYSYPVQIEPGDKVTYNIHVYNNSKDKALNSVTVSDTLPNGISKNFRYKIEIKGSNGSWATLTDYDWKDKTLVNSRQIYININNIKANGGSTVTGLPAGGELRICLEVTFDQYVEGILENKAELDQTNPKNNTQFRTQDSDYVEMKKYAVSLEKFVTSVNGEELPRYYKFDFNKDGKIDSQDVNDLTRYAIGGTENENVAKYGDYNGDGTIDTEDALGFQKFVNCDFNKDGKIDNQDVNDLIKYALGGTENENIAKYGDYNGDGIIDTGDALTLTKLVNANELLPDRVGKRLNSTLKVGNINNNPWKKNNPVEVEPGDKVIFTIRLANTGTTQVKITELSDVFTQEQSKYLVYDAEYGVQGNDTKGGKSPFTKNENGTYIITFNNPILLQPGEYTDVTIQFTVEVPAEKTTEVQILNNVARITKVQNKNNRDLDLKNDSDTTDNNQDMDYLKTQVYAVSLEKYVSAINEKTIGGNDIRSGKAEYLTASNGKYVDNTKNDKTWTWHNTWKYDNVVTVGKGDKVTYTIKVKNDSADTSVYITEITDYLPDGITYNGENFNGGEYNKTTNNGIKFNNKNLPFAGKLLAPGESATFNITVTVTEENISLNILKNTAEITGMSNINQREVKDTTPNNNKDSDYIQTKDIVIAGMVWNDLANGKGQNEYNGKYDENGSNAQTEKKVKGIKVYLYRSENTKSPIATTTTDENGSYQFAINYIKGPKATNTNRWAGRYYSYYVVFEYDGIKYTSTYVEQKNAQGGIKVNDAGEAIIEKAVWEITENDINKNIMYSNAREKLADNSNYEGIVAQSRTKFNEQFSKTPIDNTRKDISYTNRYNGSPESNYVYNEETMKMQSSTKLISIEKMTEARLQHVNLGLRGRDIFDLELNADVDTMKVTVNGQTQVYPSQNVATIRRSDVYDETNSNYYRYQNRNVAKQDMANTYPEPIEYVGKAYESDIRKKDIQNAKYPSTGLKIEVTYKLTVINQSATGGIATKIMNYYDDSYTFSKAYYLEGNTQRTLNTTAGVSGNGYKSREITTQGNILNGNGSKMEVYVVYTLNNPTTTLKTLLNGGHVATYNLTEITQYKTQKGYGQTEFSRGLIDKDSAPGSANKEGAWIADGISKGNITKTRQINRTTVDAYFGYAKGKISPAENVNELVEEDDTSKTPIIYQGSDNKRTIAGTVFRDSTELKEGNIKTGNGIQDKANKQEPGIYGATVELIEKVGNSERKIATTTTDEKGQYKFEDILPGYYIIKYHYGDTSKTILLNQSTSKESNKYSFNGEDYQATNNIGTYGAKKLNTTADYWYAYNEKEGISTGTDDETRRNNVSNNVSAFTDEQLALLDGIRKGEIISEDAKVGTATVQEMINATKMNASTPRILMTVEKTTVKDNKLEQNTTFAGDYVVNNMNFGIAEVPITKINLEKQVKEFNIIDASGSNTIASLRKNERGEWETEGNVLLAPPSGIDVSIEDEKLQGATLRITYEVTSNMETEKNFRTEGTQTAKITNIVDFVDPNLSYNASLEKNDSNWEVITNKEVKEILSKQAFANGTIPKGTVDPEGTRYTTILKAKSGNPILLDKDGTGRAEITFEKVLSSSNASFEDIVQNEIDFNTYKNIVEIISMEYGTDGGGRRDRIRTGAILSLMAGVRNDSANSETVTIHEPTGTNEINIMYYVIGAISLVILAGGVYGIKKFVEKGKDNQ